jgi:2-amino-4-hydroxy-6-hydroxymethyldihydropteridine diphosphokinase
MSDADTIELPAWARVSDRRREHIARVMALLATWAGAMDVPPDEARAWRDAARLHDALRDAPDADLLAFTPGLDLPMEMRHGPAAAAVLERDGETRTAMLEAIRWHTVGSSRWDRTGQALYMADFLEPGRRFAAEDRAWLARMVPLDFEGALRQVVRWRVEWALREGKRLYRETADLWNAIR